MFAAALSEAQTQDVLGEAASFESLDGLDLMGLLAVVGESREQKRLADIVRKAATERAVAMLDGGSVTDGRVLYRVAPKIDRKIKDGTELIQWLGPEDAAKVLNLDAAVSVERFRQLAESRGQDASELEQHFFTVNRGEPTLTEMPLDNTRTPKYAKAMTPGVIRR